MVSSLSYRILSWHFLKRNRQNISDNPIFQRYPWYNLFLVINYEGSKFERRSKRIQLKCLFDCVRVEGEPMDVCVCMGIFSIDFEEGHVSRRSFDKNMQKRKFSVLFRDHTYLPKIEKNFKKLRKINFFLFFWDLAYTLQL